MARLYPSWKFLPQSLLCLLIVLVSKILKEKRINVPQSESDNLVTQDLG